MPDPRSFNHLARIAAALPSVLEDIEAETAEAVAAKARRRVPIDTGELRDSIHVEGTDVVVDADHALPVEVGTVDTAAQPFLTPAAESERAPFHRRLRSVEARLARRAGIRR